jgi:hypothetical protein
MNTLLTICREVMMKRTAIVIISLVLASACSMGGGPGKNNIKTALEKDYRDSLQERVDAMVSLLGEKRGKEGIASAEGTADPSQVFIKPFQAEDIRELDNGDFTAKVVYTVHKGDRVHSDITERVTLTKLQDQWKVIAKDPL